MNTRHLLPPVLCLASALLTACAGAGAARPAPPVAARAGAMSLCASSWPIDRLRTGRPSVEPGSIVLLLRRVAAEARSSWIPALVSSLARLDRQRCAAAATACRRKQLTAAVGALLCALLCAATPTFAAAPLSDPTALWRVWRVAWTN